MYKPQYMSSLPPSILLGNGFTKMKSVPPWTMTAKGCSKRFGSVHSIIRVRTNRTAIYRVPKDGRLNATGAERLNATPHWETLIDHVYPGLVDQPSKLLPWLINSASHSPTIISNQRLLLGCFTSIVTIFVLFMTPCRESP